jgi:hypothetical protein
MSDPQLPREVRRRLAIIRHAQEVTGNVALTCRYYGISRQWCYGAVAAAISMPGQPDFQHDHSPPSSGSNWPVCLRRLLLPARRHRPGGALVPAQRSMVLARMVRNTTPRCWVKNAANSSGAEQPSGPRRGPSRSATTWQPSTFAARTIPEGPGSRETHQHPERLPHPPRNDRPATDEHAGTLTRRAVTSTAWLARGDLVARSTRQRHLRAPSQRGLRHRSARSALGGDVPVRSMAQAGGVRHATADPPCRPRPGRCGPGSMVRCSRRRRAGAAGA